jgi:hypothetical protein
MEFFPTPQGEVSMKTSTLERPTDTKQNRKFRLIGRLLRKLLAITAVFGATCASIMVPHFTLLSAGVEGSTYWLILIPSAIVSLVIVIFIGSRIDKQPLTGQDKASNK